MSQSDYITHKKTAHILKDQENLGNIINAQSLTDFKRFVIPNTIYDNNMTYNQLLPVNKQLVFDLELDVSGVCPTFVLCKNTQTRPNRSNSAIPMFSHYRKKISTDGYFWNQKMQEMLCLEKEFKECDDYLYRRRIWFKKED